MTSNMIHIVELGVGFKCPCKVNLNTQCPPPPQKKKSPSGSSENNHYYQVSKPFF